MCLHLPLFEAMQFIASFQRKLDRHWKCPMDVILVGGMPLKRWAENFEKSGDLSKNRKN